MKKVMEILCLVVLAIVYVRSDHEGIQSRHGIWNNRKVPYRGAGNFESGLGYGGDQNIGGNFHRGQGGGRDYDHDQSGGVGNGPYNGYEDSSYSNNGGLGGLGGCDGDYNNGPPYVESLSYAKPRPLRRCTYYCRLNYCDSYKCYYICRPKCACSFVNAGSVETYGRKGGKTFEISKPLKERVEGFDYVPPGEESLPNEGAIKYEDD
ncbi:uncharacterized protein LOC106457952 [Limulus polyphemus]|uniref:Uncharacterized protein LOC106457952 n=1 Tax=Limulus polyphemus TaxID=6850 RepID=A0ABM1S7Z3_LIMPO|nr:uncharacterized protein LOC106457952 [Limulus polyphemus]